MSREIEAACVASKETEFLWDASSWISADSGATGANECLFYMYAGDSEYALPKATSTLTFVLFTPDIMVLLTVTSATEAAIEQYKKSIRPSNEDTLDQLFTLEIGSPIEHDDLITLSTRLARYGRENTLDIQNCRLDVLLRGASVYQPPPPSKPEPVSRSCSNNRTLALTHG